MRHIHDISSMRSNTLRFNSCIVTMLRTLKVLILNSLDVKSLLPQLLLLTFLTLAATQGGEQNHVPFSRMNDLLSGCDYFKPDDINYARVFTWLMIPTIFVLRNSSSIENALSIQMLSVPRHGSLLRMGIAQWLRSLLADIAWCMIVTVISSAFDVGLYIIAGKWFAIAQAFDTFNVGPMFLGYIAGMIIIGSVQTCAHLVGGSSHYSCIAVLCVLIVPICLDANKLSFIWPCNMMMFKRFELTCGEGSVSAASAWIAVLIWLSISLIILMLHARKAKIRLYGG